MKKQSHADEMKKDLDIMLSKIPRQRVRIPGTPAPEVIVTAISDDHESLFEGRRALIETSKVHKGDTVVRFRGRGFNGESYLRLADIRFRVDVEPGLNDMPGRIEFRTTPVGSDKPEKRMVIDSTGNVGIGTANPNALLTLTSDESKIAAFTISDVQHSTLRLRRARSDETIVANGDILGFISARGFNGSNYEGGAAIVFAVDGEPELDEMPSNIDFRTTPEGSNERVSRMTIKNNGNVGIGTTNPGQLLELESTDEAEVSAFTISNGAASAFLGRRARDDGEGKRIIVEPNDTLVRLIGRGHDGDKTRRAAEIRFLVDGTPGKDDMPGRIEFGTRPAGFELKVKPRMVIDSTGNVNIGKSVPGGKLKIEDTSIDGVLLTLQDKDGTCTFNPGVGATFLCPSDARLKTNIRDAKPVLDELMTLRVRDYTVIASGDEKTGIVAQELLEVMPDIVSEGEDGYLMVSQINHWKLVKAIQELKTENDDLQARLEALEQAGDGSVSPAGPFSFSGPAPWFVFGGLGFGGLALGGLVTRLTARSFGGKQR